MRFLLIQKAINLIGTKPMRDRVFLDSKILVYSYSNSEIDKQEIARKLIADSNSFISTQVLQELCNTVTRKFKFSYEQATMVVKECCQNNDLHVNTEDTILQACVSLFNDLMKSYLTIFGSFLY